VGRFARAAAGLSIDHCASVSVVIPTERRAHFRRDEGPLFDSIFLPSPQIIAARFLGSAAALPPLLTRRPLHPIDRSSHAPNVSVWQQHLHL